MAATDEREHQRIATPVLAATMSDRPHGDVVAFRYVDVAVAGGDE
jgi:hypothetical protein